ncbi:hypothetical protein PO124_05705 [Bacillus licheniformis]|nr:hypothetical protein [Bacillus licheniformis]
MLNVSDIKATIKLRKEVSCGTTETVYDLQPFSFNSFENALSGIKPTGWSPIANLFMM